MKRIKFAIGIHNHQPVGNFDFVFEEAYQKAYLPFLQLLEKHPQIRIAQHYSGILFDWILAHYPDFIKRLRSLVVRGQLEIMTGGYYEPILVNIPDEDKMGQIKKLTQFIIDHTAYHPTGLWLAERIWEPQLAHALAIADIRYTITDDSHFKSAGLQEADLSGYYITEDNGYIVNIFPISERLRYTIPFQDVAVSIEYLRSKATEDGNNLIVFADDGEKFGIWPGTYQHCYENQWLERFFTALEANLDWIEIVHFSEALTKLPPLGNVYLPTASYREMMEWALPSKSIHQYEDFEHQLKANDIFDQFKVFVRGGFWRNFLAKYPESNNLHKKSLYVSKKVFALKNKNDDQPLFKEAQNHLWAGECNCPYWHGVFGGLYLNNLRYAVYKNMIQSERLIDQMTKINSRFKNGWIDCHTFDFDADGHNELIVETKTYNLYFSPNKGGTLFELDYKPKAINLLDTMTRREEGYHRKLLRAKSTPHENKNGIASIHDLVITKEKDMDKYLHYDWYRRSSLIDHFLTAETTIQSMATSQHNEAADFVESPYEFETKKQRNKLNIRLFKEGTVTIRDEQWKIRLSKQIQVDPQDSRFTITYQIKNLENKPVELWFGVEFNLALLAGNAPDRYYYFPGKKLDSQHLASIGIVKNVSAMSIKDEWLGIDLQFSFDKPGVVWRFPIETISQSESGFERVYQNSVILPNWKITIPAADIWESVITQNIVEISK